MKIYKEVKIFNPLYVTKLENGITLFVFDGYAIDDNGKKYRHVGMEDEEGVLETVGWCEEE